MLVVLALMGTFAMLLLLGLSILTYIFKWQANVAMVGITSIYSIVGFLGGYCYKRMSYEESIGGKLLEGAKIGTLFMTVLCCVSFFSVGAEAAFGNRFIMIWMLIVGSSALGRIL